MTRGLSEVTCGARTRSGGECGRSAGHGTDHRGIGRCRLHGGSTPTHVRAARLELVKVEEARVAERYGIGPEVDVLTALQTALNRSHAVADFWAEQVRRLESLTERGIGGSTEVAAVVRAEERARRDLARIAVDCAKLGVEARPETLNKRDAEITMEIIEGTVRGLGGNPDDPVVQAEIHAAIDDAIAAAEAAIEVGRR